jgi:(2R)-3-sulfolactate dehydrogenase (NADP+)
VESLVHEMTRDDGVRLPGARRDALAAGAAADGIEIPQALADALAR